jgi:PAS domain S-box-containing protein
MDRIRREAAEPITRTFENITDGLLTLDRDWRYTYVNANAERLLGRPRAELLGKCVWQEFPLTVGTEIERQLRRVATEQTTCEFEGHHALWKRWYENRASPTPEGGVAVYFRDITERRQMEQKLRRSEALLAEAQGLAHIGSWNWDLATGRLEWSDEHYRIFGMRPQEREMTTEYSMSFIHPDDIGAVRDIIATSMKNHEPYDCVLRVVRQDGSIRIAQSRGQTLFDARGQPVRMFGTLQDITERKKAGKALWECAEGFRRCFELGLIGMAITSPTKGCLEVNDEICRILGYEREELLSKTWAQMTYPDDLAADVALFDRVMAREIDGYTIDKRWVRKDGRIINTTISVRCVRGDDGSVEYFLAFLQDITERKRALEAIERAREAAEQANRVKDEFLATISHELRTPLAAMLIWGSLLADGVLGEHERATAIREIVSSAEAQNQLIGDLLDVSSIATGKLRIELREVDLTPVVQAAIDAVRPTANAKNVRLDLAITGEVGKLAMLADLGRLHQVLWNLLSNAVKFTPDGGRIEVRLERTGATATLTVQDSGEGIAPDFLPHVFDRFRQADGSLTRLHGGLGLGLAIVRELVQLHGGTVRAESAGEGRGATFTVQLPLIQATNSDPALVESAPF